MDIETNVREVQRRITQACERSHRLPSEITVVAVTKGFEASVLRAAFDCGVRDFGENRVQEGEKKIGQLSDLKPDIIWHMVGHLQSNKAKTAAELFDIIHSVDSVRLAGMSSQRVEQTLPVLLQVNVPGEVPKSGFAVEELAGAVEEVRPVFRKLRELRDLLGLEHLSMGMTGDFEVAVVEGVTVLRIGRAIFGDRRS